MDDIQGGGTIPSNFPKKCLNFRRRGEIQTVLWGKRPKIRAERTEKRGDEEKARGSERPKTSIGMGGREMRIPKENKEGRQFNNFGVSKIPTKVEVPV